MLIAGPVFPLCDSVVCGQSASEPPRVRAEEEEGGEPPETEEAVTVALNMQSADLFLRSCLKPERPNLEPQYTIYTP